MLEFYIKTTWDNQPVDHEPVRLQLSEDPQGCRLDVEAPFFNSPSCPGAACAGEPCPELWDYEVVEAFFLNDKEQYLEVELCPHGQHLVLILNRRRNIVKDELALDFKCEIKGNTWHGSAVIPASYMPPSVTRFNAFAIHGEGTERVYEALFPAVQKHDNPDFHRLEYFGTINLGSVSSSLVSTSASDIWKQYMSVSS